MLEGAERGPGHFAGVCTVVCKLLNIVAPDVAFFGQKDAQQVVVVRRMVRDLDLPAELAVVPTVRDPDGLALSSRNVRLGPADRERALALHRALQTARARVAAGARDAAASPPRPTPPCASRHRAGLLRPRGPGHARSRSARIERRVLVAVAARVGPARLIDNVLIDPVPVATPA